ncbi:hypothetical protein QFZ79_003382 [Arthrobacter sp. V4I6]|uniref:hypothetical protein n=1 Tax=unclassified Arthrobacter TaxID=235627 RepID=UPI0027844E28|nr:MULTISPECIES: hypothetical protein [unclassified Arthrobacter]MDQ0821010.1 hypothetical protein [Arthrobacter sp. V1I7]MDQ0855271.1 hypothetical protein [Arthrobacter sp. V4I6]
MELVNVADSHDLGKEPLDEPEVAVGDAGDGGDSFGVGEVRGVDAQAEFPPAIRQDEGEVVGPEGPVMVGEAEAAGVTVAVVPDLLKPWRFETVCLVDDEELGQAGRSGIAVLEDVDVTFPGVFDCPGDSLAGPGQLPVDLSEADGHGGGPECRFGFEHTSRDGLCVGVTGPLPLFPFRRVPSRRRSRVLNAC